MNKPGFIESTPCEAIHPRVEAIEPPQQSTSQRVIWESMDKAIDALLFEQEEEGYWCAELEGDSLLQSEYILMTHVTH
ncbi:MAG: hypothetical protein JXR73_17585 [Candidatus Omnitrophica bacterium]|nr:hypothetical protein [Candidatus Omnitrophota bacterium]